MIESWMKTHLVSDSKLQHCKSVTPPPQMTNNVGLTFSVGDIIPQFTISIEQDN